MLALRRDASSLSHEGGLSFVSIFAFVGAALKPNSNLDFMAGIAEVQAKKKVDLQVLFLF